MKTWIGVDLDGTLAYYDGWKGYDHIGEPIGDMISKVQSLIMSGHTVKIFTARAAGGPKAIKTIHNWLKKNGLPALEVTNVKDFSMEVLYDDRAFHVVRNTGRIVYEAAN